VSVVKPVYVIDKVVCFCSEADRFDVEVFESKTTRASCEVLRLNGHEFRIEPRSEHLLVEGLPPKHLLVVISFLERHSCHVRFDLADVEEHIVNLFVGVNVWTTQIIRLSNRFFHLKAVKYGERHIIRVHRLTKPLHSLNLPKHSVKHFHVHAPLCSNCCIRVQSLNHVCRPDNRNIWANGLHFLFADPFCAQPFAL